MAIAINSNFHLGAALPLDDRGYLTKAEMLTVDENIYTDYFLAVCADDGFLYMFDKSIEELDPETGKFKLFAGDVDEAIRILNSDEDTENSVRYWIKHNAANALYDTKEVVTYTISVAGEEVELTSAQINAVAAGEEIEVVEGKTLKYDADNTRFYVVDAEGDEETVTPEPHTITKNQTIKEKIEEVEELAKIELDTAAETEESILKTYVITQGGEEVGKIDIPKDLVVTSGSIIKVDKVVDEESGETLGYRLDDSAEITYTDDDVADEESPYYGYPTTTGKHIKLIIANQKLPVCIDIREIMPEGAGETTEDIIANIEVGGIAEGDTVPAGTDLQEFITQLIVKYFPPTIKLTSSVTNLVQRVGTVLNDVVLTATVGKKSLDVTGVTIDGTEQTDVAAEGGEYTKTIATVDDSVIFTASATDGKETNSTKVEFKFVYPYMHGVADSVDAIDLDTMTEVVELKGTKAFTYTAANQYCVFAMPSEYADLTSILDPSSFENLKSWTKITKTNAAGESYKVYYTNTPVTASNFKYTFK